MPRAFLVPLILALAAVGIPVHPGAAVGEEAPPAPAAASTTQGDCPFPQVVAHLQQMESTDVSAGLSIAEASAAYKHEKSSLSSGERLVYSGAYHTFSVDKATCTPVIESLGVPYDVKGSNPPVHFVISEDPQMTKVTSAVTQRAPSSSDSRRPVTQVAGTALWSGYVIYDTDAEFDMNWRVPTASGPSTGCGTWASGNLCRMYIWNGQTVNNGGSGGIAQEGIEIDEQATFLCCGYTQTYTDFWEFQTYNSVQTCASVSPNDLIEATTLHSGTQYWDYIYDASTNHGCSAWSPSGFMGGGPQQANFIFENPQDYPEPIPKIPSTTVTGLSSSHHDMTSLLRNKKIDVPQLSPGTFFYSGVNGCTAYSFNDCSWFTNTYTG